MNTQRTDIKPGTWCYVADIKKDLKYKYHKRIVVRSMGDLFSAVAHIGSDEQAQQEKFESGVYDETLWEYAVPCSELDAPPAPQRGDLVLVWDEDSKKVKRIFLANVGGRYPIVTTCNAKIEDYESGNYEPIIWKHCEPYTEPLPRHTHAELEAMIGHKFELVEGEE